MSDPTSQTTNPEKGQLWVPDGHPNDGRTITLVHTEKKSGDIHVYYTLPESCPCCGTLLRAERNTETWDDLPGWNEWVKAERAICTKTATDD